MLKDNKHNMEWLSIHIFYKGDIYSSDCDRIILEVIDTYIDKFRNKKIFEKFFFIRYSELGTHVRLRLYGNKKILSNQGIKTIEQHIENSFPASLFLLPRELEKNKNYLWIEYEPENNRYGGIEGIKIAEVFFFYSSICSIELLKEIKNGDKANRLGKGLITMLVLLFVFFEKTEKASSFIKNYGINYLRPFTNNEKDFIQLTNTFNDAFDNQSDKMIEYTLAIWSALQEGAKISQILDLYKSNLNTVKNKLFSLQKENLLTKNSNVIENWDMTLNTIIPSYIHMMNNRLGISIKDESYLAHIIYWSFDKMNKTTIEKT